MTKAGISSIFNHIRKSNLMAKTKTKLDPDVPKPPKPRK